MTDLSAVKWLHVEATTRCNAHCPACSRNNNGYGLKEDLIIEDLSVERLKQVLDMLPALESIQLCGTLGDVIAAKNINEILDVILSSKITYLQVHTNGSLKTKSWWTELGQRLSTLKHNIWFALDGMEDTHSIYRQGTNYNKVIENAIAFIEAGGHATWQFIPFKHNQHQLKTCLVTSRKLGFKDFKIVKSVRLPGQARHYKTNQPFDLEPFELDKKYNNWNAPIGEKIITPENCMHIEYPSLYLNANGLLAICCFLPRINYLNTSFATGIKNNNPATVCVRRCGTKK